MRHDSSRCPPGEGGSHEVVPIKARAADGEEKLTRRKGPRVDGITSRRSVGYPSRCPKRFRRFSQCQVHVFYRSGKAHSRPVTGRFGRRRLTSKVLVSSPPVAKIPQSAPCHVTIIKGDRLVFHDLIGFMPLPCQNDHIAFARLPKGPSDGRVTINLSSIRARRPLQPNQHVIHDSNRVFGARVVGGQEDMVCQLSSCLAHERTLCPVAVASAAEDYEQP